MDAEEVAALRSTLPRRPGCPHSTLHLRRSPSLLRGRSQASSRRSTRMGRGRLTAASLRLCWRSSGATRLRVRAVVVALNCDAGVLAVGWLTPVWLPPDVRAWCAAESMLKDVDPDRSGQITFEEFVTLMNRAKGAELLP